MVRLQKFSQTEIIAYAGADYEISLKDKEKSEMAIPSYLHPNPLVRWLMWRRYEVIAAWLELNETSRVFEFGCGTGIFLPTLCSQNSTVFALDLAPEIARKVAGMNGLAVHFVDDLAQLEDGSLDVIVAADVLEHIQDVSVTIAGLWKKLKPGGRLLVSGPTENLLYKILRVVVGFEGKGDYHFSDINKLIPIIESQKFFLMRETTLPSAFIPALFRVTEFQKLTNEEGQ